MGKIKQTEQKEIGRIKLTNTREVVASMVDGEKLGLRVFIESASYTGATKRLEVLAFLMRSGLSLRRALTR